MFLDISENDDYLESNKMHGINGYLYANLPGLDLCVGDRVSWHMIGLGNEVDMHTAYFYGNTFTYNSNMKDTVSLLPGNILCGQNTDLEKPLGPFDSVVSGTLYGNLSHFLKTDCECFVSGK